MPQGFMYLVAIIDWYDRYVISWALSNTLGDEYFELYNVERLHQSLGCKTPWAIHFA